MTGDDSEDGRMKLLLSFAVGAILGDIFFHLIPESLQSHLNELGDSTEIAHKKVGMSVVAGIFMFIIVEMILEKWSHPKNDDSKESTSLTTSKAEGTIYDRHHVKSSVDALSIFNKEDLTKLPSESKQKFSKIAKIDNNNCLLTDLNSPTNNLNKYVIKTNSASIETIIANNKVDEIVAVGSKLTMRKKGAVKSTPCDDDECSEIVETSAKSVESIDSTPPNGNYTNKLGGSKECKVIDVAGYLSLVANGFDNFTHGLAIGASFLVGPKVGLLTTFVIFIHEIPHEICDYAILVNAGFSRWDAVKAQSSVSLFGIIGTATALYVKSVQTLNSRTVWILPFSAGGFLYIALVNLLPEILDHKTDLSNSIGQIACVIVGAAFMAFIAVL